MKTYVEIGQPTTTGNLFATNMEKLQSFLQSLSSKVKNLSLRKSLIFIVFLIAVVALSIGCHPFSLLMVTLFVIALGVLINEFVQYIRFIREMDKCIKD